MVLAGEVADGDTVRLGVAGDALTFERREPASATDA
jgi:hypothetical protein